MLSTTRELARQLYEAKEPIDLYVLHKKFGTQPAEALLSAKFFAKLGVAKLEGAMLIPMDHARAWLHQHRAKFFFVGSQPWRRPPRSRMRAFAPYLPDLAKVERDFFINLLDQPKSVI